jgi:hypothetical protein
MIDSDHSYFRDRVERQDTMEIISNTKNNRFTDAGIISYYKTEYFREWNNSLENGILLTANDIRTRLNLK